MDEKPLKQTPGLRPVSSEPRRGAALVSALVAVVVLSGLTAVVVGFQQGVSRARNGAREHTTLHYVAQGALAESVLGIAEGGDGSVGTRNAPTSMGSSEYFVESYALPDDATRLVATARDRQRQVSLEAVVRPGVPDLPLFTSAISAQDRILIESNSLVDSYDPEAGTYREQSAVDGYANDAASIQTNGSVNVSTNTEIRGSITSGPDADDGTWLSGGATVSGETASAEESLEFPEIELPFATARGEERVRARYRG